MRHDGGFDILANGCLPNRYGDKKSQKRHRMLIGRQGKNGDAVGWAQSSYRAAVRAAN